MCYASDDKYEELVNVLESNFQRAGVLYMSNGELLRILEDVMSYIPSSTNKNEVCDISLYIHSKVTAALASCMYEYFQQIRLKIIKNTAMTNPVIVNLENRMHFCLYQEIFLEYKILFILYQVRVL